MERFEQVINNKAGACFNNLGRQTLPYGLFGYRCIPEHAQDDLYVASLYNLLEMEVLPMYYDYLNGWIEIIKNGMKDIIRRFDNNRMTREYYQRLYMNE